MYECGSCFYLDKSRKIEAENKMSYRYGCNNTKATKGYVVGWIIKGRGEKSELSTMGCGDWADKKDGQVSMDMF